MEELNLHHEQSLSILANPGKLALKLAFQLAKPANKRSVYSVELKATLSRRTYAAKDKFFGCCENTPGSCQFPREKATGQKSIKIGVVE